jgi:hypothetical protein
MEASSVISRRSLLAAPAVLLLPRRSGAEVISSGANNTSVIGTPFPGQPGNPVGFAAAPGFNTGANPNGAGQLSAPISTAAYASSPGFVNGTPGNPTKIMFVDFDGAGYSNSISSDGLGGGGKAIHDITFIGCRFQSCSQATNYNVECFKSGSSNITFSYCSMTPRRTAGPFYSKVISPAVLDVTVPGAWPSASVGTGANDLGGGVSPITGGGAGAYQVPYLSSPETALAIGTAFGTYMIVDHCDLWGSGFAISGAGNSTTPHTITDNWMHDNRFPIAPSWDQFFPYVADTVNNTGAIVAGSNGQNYLCLISNTGVNPVGDKTGHWGDNANRSGFFYTTNDHSEGLGYAQGTLPAPANWTIRHNTIASLGNTEAFPWQSTVTTFQNIVMINNYLSGFNNVADFGTDAAGGPNTGWVVTDNIFATDLKFNNCMRDGTHQSTRSQFTSTGNLWRRNKLRVYPGDTWSTSTIRRFDGQFVLPMAGSHFGTTDWAL